MGKDYLRCDDLGYSDFIRCLLHDDRDSAYILARRTEAGWRERAVRARDLMAAEVWAWPAEDTYLTLNGFPGHSRRAEGARQVNSLVFDIDLHGESETTALDVVAAVEGAADGGELPMPTMAVATGRGVHVYYVLGRSIPCRLCDGAPNRRALDYLSDVRSRLAAVFDRVLAGLPGAENDNSVSDLSRVVRVPGTYNSAAGAYCSLVFLDEGRTYRLADLGGYGDRDLTARRRPCPAPPRSRREAAVRGDGGDPVGGPGKQDGLLRHRLLELARLRDLRESGCGKRSCTNYSRNNMVFVFYNTASQLYDRATAQALARDFNDGFAKPLPSREVEAVFSSVSRNGSYKISARTLMRKFLRMTESEADAIGFCANGRQLARKERKEANRAAKAERNARIVELCASGRTQAEVARAMGLSRATVNAVVGRSRREGPRKAPLASLARAFLDRAAQERRDVSNSVSYVLGCEGPSLLPSARRPRADSRPAPGCRAPRALSP